MAAGRNPTWTEGLDNFGENLIRLSTSLKALEDAPTDPSGQSDLVNVAGRIAETFVPAFYQTPGILVANERAFLNLLDVDFEVEPPSDKGEKNVLRADHLIHEAILGSQELVALLERVSRSRSADHAVVTQILRPALYDLVDSIATVGWEMKEVCHEYLSEVKLARRRSTMIGAPGRGYGPLVHDMATLARQLRRTRRTWYRLRYRLEAALRSG